MAKPTTKLAEINRILAHKGDTTPAKSLAEGYKKLAKVYDDVDVPNTIQTSAATLQWWAGVLTGKCKTTFVVKDEEDGSVIESPTITVKSGAVIGSGTAVTPVAGVYSLLEGKYNYSVTKAEYVTKSAVIDITEALLIDGALVIVVELEASN